VRVSFRAERLCIRARASAGFHTHRGGFDDAVAYLMTLEPVTERLSLHIPTSCERAVCAKEPDAAYPRKRGKRHMKTALWFNRSHPCTSIRMS
jgi:hypothetical protein